MDTQIYDMALAAIAFMVGTSFGSFVSLASYRLPRSLDVVRKPSMCPSCGATLRARDLVPLFSWLLAGGKCRHCGEGISPRYPLIELLLGLAFLLFYMQYGLTLEAVMLALLVTTLLLLIVADAETGLLPDEAQIALLLLGIGYHYMLETEYVIPLYGLAAGLVVGLGLRYGYRILKKRDGLGLGDVKFFAIAGLWLGITGLVPFFMLSGILGIATALLWRLLGRGEIFPFGPALAVSLGLCVIFPVVPAFVWQVMTGWIMAG